MSAAAFIHDRVVLGPTLVVPVRTLWRAYLAYCEEWGFDPDGAEHFVRCVSLEEGVTVRNGGRGRLRRCFEGVGLAVESCAA